jgi:hypothetical protein
MTILREIKKRIDARYRSGGVVDSIHDSELLVEMLQNLCAVIDAEVERGNLNPRSAIADARLRIGEPFEEIIQRKDD